MADWVKHIADRFHPEVSRLWFVSDSDRLLEVPEINEAIQLRGFELFVYGETLEFRHFYEDQLRGQALDDIESPGVVVSLGDMRRRDLPWDMLVDGEFLALGIRDILPRLHPAALRAVPRTEIAKIAEAHRKLSGHLATENLTFDFLLSAVYGVSVSLISTSDGLLEYLVRRHYLRESLPPSLDQRLANALTHFAPPGMDLFVLLSDREEFYRWLQTKWNVYVSSWQNSTIAETETSFNAEPVRVYLDNLFVEGVLQAVEVDAIDAPEWMRAGIVGLKEDSISGTRKLLNRLEGTWAESNASYDKWINFAWKWASLRSRLGELPSGNDDVIQSARSIQERMEEDFGTWMDCRFAGLGNLATLDTPIVVTQIARVVQRALVRGERVALVVVDGMAIEHWLRIRSSITRKSEWEISEDGCFAWVPTLTSISRQAIFAGRSPRLFSDSWNTTNKEEFHLRRLASDSGISAAGSLFSRVRLRNWSNDDTLAGILPSGIDPRLRLLGLVVNDIDDMGHRTTLGLQEMHRDVGLWAERGYLNRLVEELIELDFTVFLTSDHGSVDVVGEGQPQEGILVEERSLRARVYSDAAFADPVRETYPHARTWKPTGLPEGTHVLLASSLTAFAPPGHPVIAHGGVSLEEVIVPFIRIKRKP